MNTPEITNGYNPLWTYISSYNKDGIGLLWMEKNSSGFKIFSEINHFSLRLLT